jgi:hypothetical protein
VLALAKLKSARDANRAGLLWKRRLNGQTFGR